MTDLRVFGRETGVPLDDLTPLLARRRCSGFGQEMPPLSASALMLSAELVASTYAMDMQDWVRTGWRDVTAQVERDVHPFGAAEGAGARERLTTGLRQWLTQTMVRHANPIGDMAGALRQLNHDSDTGRAIVMAHPAADGRSIIAICFMGTTGHLYDWISNLRMDAEDGMHRGFLQLTRQFEGNEGRIAFPETAKAMGLERLTLTDVLEEAKRPDSRFLLWITGHSQGGALVQLYVQRKLTESGVLAQNVLGYGFASPSVAIRGAVADPGAFPVYLLENSEDVVPRSGAQLHLGHRLICRTDAALRSACYTWPRDAESIRCRRVVRPFVERMQDMPTILLTIDALLLELISRPGAELVDAVSGLSLSRTPLRRLAGAADMSIDAMLRYMCTRIENGYRAVTGGEPDRNLLKAMQGSIHQVMRVTGVKGFTLAFSQLVGQPHASGRRGEAAWGVYPYIARAGVGGLVHAMWREDGLQRSDRLGEVMIVRRANRAERVRAPRSPRRAARK